MNKNLKTLRQRDPDTADLIDQASDSSVVSYHFEPSKQSDAMTGVVVQSDETGKTGKKQKITLASQYKPLDEAKRFAELADLQKHAAFVVMGVGVGHHLDALLERMAGQGIIIVYEPDPALLKNLFEKVDCTNWLAAPNLTLFVGEVDAGILTSRLEQQTQNIAQGTQIMTWTPTRRLHESKINAFSQKLTQLVSFCRTNLATTLVISVKTCRNLANNLSSYAGGHTIDDLKDAAKGCPAILVSAGPSLAKNIHLLTDPDIRKNVIVIAVQTVLKPLLARGIRPDFVTALDYHEISKRFYEGIEQLDDVTLIAEPKANCAILDNYPGPVRLLKNKFLDLLLGSLAKQRDGLRAGSTVAHLSLYFAQYLGCDPIVLIGQDLGFSDGLYYCPGTAIHEVWAPELSPYNTLEMMEWKRIVRHKTHLQKHKDIFGKPIYSDEQMMTYLKQFERDFADAPQTIIDASQGGMPKQNTTQMTLVDALEQYATKAAPKLSMVDNKLDTTLVKQTYQHMAHRCDQVRELRQLSQATVVILKEMIQHQSNGAKMEKLFKQVNEKQQRVAELGDIFSLVNELNQVGAFNRIKADRAIQIEENLNPIEKQKRQLLRDIENIEWIVQACDETLDMFEQATGRLRENVNAMK